MHLAEKFGLDCVPIFYFLTSLSLDVYNCGPADEPKHADIHTQSPPTVGHYVTMRNIDGKWYA